MEKCYTDLKLIRFLYKDTGIAEYFETQHMIEEDAQIAKKFAGFTAAFKALPKLSFNPRISSLQNILGKSREAVFSAS